MRSIAALSVTVTIIGSDHGATRATWCAVRLAYQPIRPATPGRATERDATSGRCAEQPLAGPDLRRGRAPAPAARAARRRPARRPARRAAGRRGRRARSGSAATSATRLAPVRRAAPRVGARRADRVDDAVLREPAGEQRLQVGVALRARRAAEDRRVDRDARAARGRDLRPAGAARVAGLDADHAGDDAEQVVPGVQRAAAGDRVVALGARSSRTTGICIATRREQRHVARARDVRRARRARRGGRSACRSGRARAAFAFISARERASKLAARRERERVGGVVRALDQRAPRAGRGR